jgi:hypothetical protein
MSRDYKFDKPKPTGSYSYRLFTPAEWKQDSVLVINYVTLEEWQQKALLEVLNANIPSKKIE